MARERNTEQKRKKTPPRSLFQSAPAQVMAPRLMVILSTLALLAIGLVMVYSSSSITSYVEEGDALGETLKQCAFAVLGIVIAIAIVLFFNQERMQGTAGVLFWAGCCVLILNGSSWYGGLGRKTLARFGSGQHSDFRVCENRLCDDGGSYCSSVS